MSDNTKDDKPETTSEALGNALKTSLHEQVFGSDPNGQDHDTPAGAIGENVVQSSSPIVPSGFQPMLNVGDTDRHH